MIIKYGGRYFKISIYGDWQECDKNGNIFLPQAA
jgi:hypothetical protein